MPSIKYLIGRVANMNYKRMFSKINSIHKKTHKSRLAIFNDMRECAIKYGAGYMDYDLFEMYNLTPEERDTYLTRGRNNDLVVKYNNPEYTHFFHNKNEFNQKFNKYLQRDWLDISSSSKKEVLSFIKNHSEFMVKPTDGTCGHGIEKIITKDYANAEEIYTKLNNTTTNYILEEVIIQDKRLDKLCPTSINTVRVITILDDLNNPHVICAYLRLGNGAIVDNFNSGGMVTPVDELTGIIKDKALDKEKNLYEYHPLTNTKIKGYQLPDWDQVLKLVKEASHEVPEVRYVGWDVCFSSNGPIFVEGNEYPGHDIYQLPVHTPDKIGLWPKFTNANLPEKTKKN